MYGRMEGRVETLGGYGVELCRTEAALLNLEADWRRLYAEASASNPFLTYEWTAACWAEVRQRARPFVITLRREGRLVAVAPLRQEQQAGFRVLRFMGDGRSDYLGFLSAPDEGNPEAGLLSALRAARGTWDLAVLRQLGEPFTRLREAPLPDGLRARSVEGTVAPHFSHGGDWESAVKYGPSWLRRMVKESRRFERLGGTVERLVGEEAAEQVATVASIEAQSWKGREGVGRFQHAAAQELLRQTLRGLGGRGEMELWLARIDGNPVAFEINFLPPGRIWLYQGAYREDFKKYSPGAVLDYRSIQRAWEAGAREYDFMSGDEAYKLDRTSALRPLHYLAMFPATVRGSLAYSLLVAPRWRLKEYPAVRAAFQFWVHRKSTLPALVGRLRRAAPARQA